MIGNKPELKQLAAILFCVLMTCSSGARQKRPTFNGTWRGFFETRPIGSPPVDKQTAKKSIHPFEIRMKEVDGIISGDFAEPDFDAPIQPLRNAKRFGNRACFDVNAKDGTDMRWCVEVRDVELNGDHDIELEGAWNVHLEAGAAGNDMGTRPPLYEVSAMFYEGDALPPPVPRFNGTWRGTFDGMPLGPPPNDKETKNPFEIHLNDANGRISGEFRQLGSTAPAQPVRNGKRFGNRACFDVDLDDETDMRWCVELHHGNLEGLWNLGPEGGPALAGQGPGVRAFSVKAKRVAIHNSSAGSQQ